MKSFAEGIESFGFIFIWIAFIIIAAVFNYFKKKAQLSKNNNRTNTGYRTNTIYEKDYTETYVEEDSNALENLKGVLEQRNSNATEIIEEIRTETKESINIKENMSSTTKSYTENIDESYISKIEDMKPSGEKDAYNEEDVVINTKQVYRVLIGEEMMKQAVVYDAILNPKRINYSSVSKRKYLNS